MKRYTSRFLKSVAVGHMAFPLAYVLAAAVFFDVPAAQCASILLSPWYWALSALSVCAGYGLWEMRRWSWYVFLATAVLTAYVNAVVALDFGVSHHKAVAFVVAEIALMALVIRVGREVRVPYFLPKIRWWESNPRYRLSVPAKLGRDGGTEVEGQILDLSATGCFLKLREDLKADELVQIQFTIFGKPIRTSGTVVWRTQSAVTHPKGIGVKFSPMPRPHKKVFKAVTRRLKQITTLYRTSRYLLSEEEYLKKLTELQTQELDVKVKLVG